MDKEQKRRAALAEKIKNASESELNEILAAEQRRAQYRELHKEFKEQEEPVLEDWEE